MSVNAPMANREATARQVADRYFRAWTTGDALGVSMALSPFATITTPIPVSWPGGVAVRLTAQLVDGAEVVQIYDAVAADRRKVRVWERLQIDDGQIVSIEMMFDVAAMRRFMG